MRRLFLLVLLILLGQGSASAAGFTSRATGNWNAAATWATLRTGTITTSTASATVTGVGTLFLTELANGNQLFTANGVLIGTVLNRASNTSLTLTANAASNNAAVAYYATTAATPAAADDVRINNTHNVTLAANQNALSLLINTGGTLTTGSASLTIAAGAGTVTINGNVAGNGNAASRIIKNSTGNLSGSGTITDLNDLTVAADTTIAAGTTLTFTGAECRLDLSANVDMINNGTLTFAAAQCGTTKVINLANPSSFTNNATVIAGSVVGANAAGSVWTNAANSTLEVTAALLATGTLNASANGNTVRYNVNAAQAIKLPSSGQYYDLEMSGGNTKTFAAGTYNILNDLTINTGVTATANTNDPVVNVTGNMVVDGTYTASNNAASKLTVTGDLSVGGTFTGNTSPIDLAGNFTVDGTYTSGAGLVTFTGGNAQTWGGGTATTITNLTVNKSGNGVTIACGTPSPTVTGTLTLTSGNIVTSGSAGSSCATDCANQVPIIVGAAGTIAGGAATSYVLGALRKNFNAAGTLNFRGVAGQDEFPIGITGSYLPIEITAGTTSTAGNIVACVTATDHPSMTEASGGGIDTTRSVNRYWSMTTTTINNAAVLMDATFKFPGGASEYDAAAVPGSFIVERWDGVDWNSTTLVTAGATSTRASGINISSTTNDFEIGQPLATFPSVLGTFNAFDTTTPAGAVLGVIQTKQAGTSFSVRVVRLVNNGIDAAYNQAGVTVELYNATNNTGAFTNGCRSTWAAIAGSSVTVNFAAGVATATFAAANVPNVFRDARVHIVKAGAGVGEGCSSDRFAIRPTSLTADGADGTWQTAGIARTLNNISATPGVAAVHAASDPGATTPRPFTLRAAPQAAGGQSASNYDGNPTVVSGFPVCCTPSTTPACGTLPAACAAGTLSFTPASWVGTGTRTNPTAHYNEAGVLNLGLEDASFASVDANDGSNAVTRTVPATGTASIGRFVPDHFTFTSPNVPALQTFGSSCASRSFTYVGQPFWYATLPSATIEARSAGDAVTTNYRGVLFTLAAAGVSEAYSNNGTGPTLNVGSAVSPPQLSTGNGTGTYTAAASATNVNLTYARSNTTPIALFTANISLTVTASDGVESGFGGNGTVTQASSLVFDGAPAGPGGPGIDFDSGSEFRYGRLRLLNASGPISVDLPLVLRAEHYVSAAAGFVLNSNDNCTPLAAGNFKLFGHTPNLTTGNMPDSNISVPVRLTGGVANGMKLLKANPAATGSGSVRICFDLDTSSGVGDTTCQAASTAANRSYLQGPWTSAGTYDKDPAAQVNVGTFGAQPNNFIFFRENY
ncbi:hypothetical protein AYO46_06810 [Betaproteobacteria bacterium SCGC AG-212-J23]|nr:hypothetical protein AYO46_06810 [Betaproteobacteria bacterium SCGC AG-212-J23]